ncbi:MAG: transposase [Sphaerochaeta sp.]|nr:transposase [Sphaerochaeta sp.]
MAYSTPNPSSLQSLLFDTEDFGSCFFREPSERELEFLGLYATVQQLLSPGELTCLLRGSIKGRVGYDLLSILGIMLLKLHFRQPTMKETLLLLRENGNLKDILGISTVPSQATACRLSRVVERVVDPAVLHERVIQAYKEAMDNRMVGHLSIDSTIIEAREKPFVKEKEASPAPVPPKKKGRKKKGSPEEKAYLEQKARAERERLDYLAEDPLQSISRLEMRCSLTAKQNSKGKRQWFIGYKAHLATDDFGVSVAYAVTGACVHDCKVAVPLMKTAHQRTDFLYALMDKGYLNPDIDAYAAMIGRKAIIDQRAHRSIAPLPMEKPEAARYKARTTVERTNSELKDGCLPDKIYRRGCHARYDIELAILLTTLRKARNVLLARKEARVGKSA